ncbi:MAG TPA: universal stress protein [Rubrobacter sp.]|nr:universal stress protein [Rubrobacter sp.]
MDIQHGGVIRPNSVLLATDGSKDAALAARVATDLSQKTGAQLHVAHAWRHHIQGLGYPTVAWTDYSYIYEREARRLLAAQVDSIEATGDLVAEPHLLQGPPIDAILDLCDELRPGLVVMGSRGLGPVGRIFVGSVSEGVVHHARCPVLVVRGGDEAWPPERIVAGDDGSESAGLAAGMAAGIGSLFGAENVLVRAHRNPPQPIGGWSASDRRRLDEARARETEELNRRAQALGDAVGSRSETRVLDADATLALLLVAEEGDERKTLLAVGSRGLSGMGRARLGSVSTNIIRAARGPVLIVSRPAEEITTRASRETIAAAPRSRPATPSSPR